MSTTSMLASWGPYLLAFSFVVLTGLLIVTLFILTRQPVHPAIRNLLIALVAIEILLFGLHTTTSADADITGFWDWFFDLDKESTLGTMFSAVQMALVGMVALINGIGIRRYGRWPRLYWGLLAAGFMFLGFDEYFMIHEYLFERWGLPGEWWRYLYLGAGGMLVLLSGYVYRRWMRPEPRLFILFFVGLVVTALSGIALEPLIWNARCPERISCFDPLLAIEETGEMVGATIVLASLLLFAQRHLDPAAWRAAYRLSLGASVALGLALVFNLWGAPALEARTLAERTSISYLDGALELVGYRLSKTVFEPGDTLEVTLYWYTRSGLPENYNQSVRLLARPEGDQVAEFDLGALDGTLVPSRAWLPGTVARSSLRFNLPDTLPVTQSYWVGVRLWYGDWQASRGLDISETDSLRLTPDLVVISNAVAVGPAPNTPPEIEIEYVFDDGLRLAGYNPPGQIDDSLALDFWWKADRDIERDLTQFVHLVDLEGTPVLGYDQPPFEGRFVTYTWPAGTDVQDSWRIDIPEDVPPGDYAVYTGLYDSITLQRSPVFDAEGHSLLDDMIYLGDVTLGGDGGRKKQFQSRPDAPEAEISGLTASYA